MKITLNKIMVITFVVTNIGLFAPTVWADDDAFCSNTSQAAFKACRYDVKDDLWETKGICINISDSSARKECYQQAKLEEKESSQLCKEQYEARQGICDSLGESRYDPEINPDDFVDPLTIGDTTAINPFLPLVSGFTRVYQAGEETVTVTVTNETIEILGVKCIVVRDTVEEDGELIEDTVDWFAQDIYGNVWYFGEIAKNYEEGMLSDLDGSWEAGKDGAKAGIVMKGVHNVGDVYRQEWALAEAEDMGEILDTAASESSPAASCVGSCLLTHDFTPLEPEVSERKYYAPGIGVIVAFDTEDPDDREELIGYHF